MQRRGAAAWMGPIWGASAWPVQAWHLVSAGLGEGNFEAYLSPFVVPSYSEGAEQRQYVEPPFGRRSPPRLVLI